MIIEHSLKLKAFSLAIVAGIGSSYFVGKIIRGQETLSLGTPHFAEDKVLTAIAGNSLPQVETASQISPDGSKNLVMKVTPGSEKTKTFEFTTTDSSGGSAKVIYTAGVGESEKFSLPFNTWSPDDKYVFILKNGNGALVFKADGKPVGKDQTYFDIPAVFSKKVKENVYKETTGWASNTLLIVNSVKPDGSKGLSYWFEVPSQAIVQLSSQF